MPISEVKKPVAVKSRISEASHQNLVQLTQLTQHSVSDVMRHRLDWTTIYSLPTLWIAGALSPEPQSLASQRSRLLLSSNTIINDLNQFNRLVMQPQKDPLGNLLLYNLLRGAGRELKTLMLTVGSLVP